MADQADKIRAAILLRASCETALERFDDDGDLDDIGMAFRIGELRDVLDGYLAETARRFGRPTGSQAS